MANIFETKGPNTATVSGTWVGEVGLDDVYNLFATATQPSKGRLVCDLKQNGSPVASISLNMASLGPAQTELVRFDTSAVSTADNGSTSSLINWNILAAEASQFTIEYTVVGAFDIKLEGFQDAEQVYLGQHSGNGYCMVESAINA